MSNDVSLVATLLNEERALPHFLDSIIAQTRAPREIILVDGGSRDRSCEIIRRYISRGARIDLLIEQGANRARGRNIGIRYASNPIIAVTDVGCRLAKDWLEQIVRPLEDGSAEVAAGFYCADALNLFERAVAAATVQSEEEINPKNFLPSSRSIAFLKESWEKVGGYPEQKDNAEDTYFDLALKRAGARFKFVPEALVSWKQQETFSGIFRQFNGYARVDGAAGLSLGHYRKAIGLVVWKVLLLAALLASIIFGFVSPLWPLGLIVLTGLGYCIRYIIRSRKRRWDWGAALFSPLIMVVVDTANLTGYLAGRKQRKRR